MPYLNGIRNLNWNGIFRFGTSGRLGTTFERGAMEVLKNVFFGHEVLGQRAVGKARNRKGFTYWLLSLNHNWPQPDFPIPHSKTSSLSMEQNEYRKWFSWDSNIQPFHIWSGIRNTRPPNFYGDFIWAPQRVYLINNSTN